MELSTMITGAQQQGNATATQFDSSDFIVRRPEEINLIGYLHQLLGILNELRCHGKVGRPRFLVKFL